MSSSEQTLPVRNRLFPMWTGRGHVPWLWVVLFAFPTFSHTLLESISGAALTFTMKKFVSDPALITLLGSTNIAFNFLVGPWAAWKSDQIWTPLGRRRPFLIFGWAVLFFTLICVPLAPTLPWLVLCIVVYQFCGDLGYVGTWNPLFYEMIPSHQRGRAVVVKRTGSLLARLGFNLLLIGQFDETLKIDWTLNFFDAPPLVITGEKLIYWTGAFAVLLVVLQMLFLVRESQPQKMPTPSRFSPVALLRELFGVRQYRLLFLLVFCSMALTSGLGQLFPLLITEQFGFTKKDLGLIWSINHGMEIFVILPLALLLVDRLDRFRVFQAGLILSTVQNIVFWFYVKNLPPGQGPDFYHVVFFNLWNSAVDVMASVALEPLIFDFIPRNKMGTLNSGFVFVRGALSLLVMNGVGLWVKYFSQWMQFEGGYDYMSGFLFTFVIGILGILATMKFNRHLKAGELVKYGLLEEQAAQKAERSSM